MTASNEQIQSEIDSNLENFLRQLPKLLAEHPGKYALLRHGAVAGIFATALEAQAEGNKRFADALFSIQKIAETSSDLGFFSHAVHLG